MAPDRRDARSDSPQVVTVEVTVAAHRRSPRDRVSVAGRRRAGLAIAVGAMGALAAILAIWLSGATARHADVTIRGPAGVAAAYGYPLACMSVTIPAAGGRTFAQAELTHAPGCGGITGYAPAIFHYIGGRWRLVPDAIGYMCNRNAVPAAVDRAFELCVMLRPGCARIGTPGQGRPAAPLGWPCARLPKISGVV